MTLSRNTIECVEKFIFQFATKKFSDDEILFWAMKNLPTYSKDTFYFFKKTLREFYYPNGHGFYVINQEKAIYFFEDNEKILKELKDKFAQVKK